MKGERFNSSVVPVSRAGQDGRVAPARGGFEIRRQGKPLESTVLAGGAVYLVVDCSNSMTGDKIAQAKKGALDFAGQALAKKYAVGMISFANGATHICEPGEELSQVQANLHRLEADGSTDMAAGISLATVKLKGERGPLALVVITDGVPDDRQAALAEAEIAKKAGIDVITVGTDDADRSFLQKLASRKDLVVVVRNEILGQGIATAAGMLPGGPGSAGHP